MRDGNGGAQPISFEVALRVADAAVFAKTSKHLKNIEVTVLRGAWMGQRYDQIAEENGYAPEYIKHDVGPKLWQSLSQSLGEKVSKTNWVAVLAQKAEQEPGVRGQGTGDSQETHPPSSVPSITELEAPIGLVPLDSVLYVERPPIESRCYEEIGRSGSLIRIKAPSQMGKTSLMVRILAHAKRAGTETNEEVQTVALSLQQADKAVFFDLDRFLRWFCAAIARKLQLSYRIEDYWSETFGSKSNCTAFFEDCILPEVNGPLVLALDQVDEVFLHPEIRR
ncbi:AAA-like domain-containing protein [Kovacikia minuta]|uniref:AAA-like domain-containing protein n=1 Tax=Kovacikia minuta TaxID=2931930 RepID=UPI0020C7DE09